MTINQKMTDTHSQTLLLIIVTIIMINKFLSVRIKFFKSYF